MTYNHLLHRSPNHPCQRSTAARWLDSSVSALVPLLVPAALMGGALAGCKDMPENGIYEGTLSGTLRQNDVTEPIAETAETLMLWVREEGQYVPPSNILSAVMPGSTYVEGALRSYGLESFENVFGAHFGPLTDVWLDLHQSAPDDRTFDLTGGFYTTLNAEQWPGEGACRAYWGVSGSATAESSQALVLDAVFYGHVDGTFWTQEGETDTYVVCGEIIPPMELRLQGSFTRNPA